MLLASSQCTADTDCKGERICSAGRCVDPQSQPPAPKANVGMPGPGGGRVSKQQLMVCSEDRDCGTGLVCRRGDCLTPTPAAPGPAAVPATFPAPAPAAAAVPAVASAPADPLRPGRCVNDVDCPGDSVCTHGACTFQQPAAASPASSAQEKFKAPNILSVRRFRGGES